jgi:3-oxoacyl-[acyl-carrier-protein] synthase II
VNGPGMPSIVITGVGLVTPLGRCPDEILRRMAAGETRAAHPSGFDSGPFACHVCAEIPDFDGEQYVPEPKTLRLMNRDAQLAVAAARLALADAAVEVGHTYPAEDIALYGATGLAGLPLAEVSRLVHESTGPDGRFDLRRFGDTALKRVRPVLSFKILNNMSICFVSIFTGIQGANAVYTPWEGQGAQAIAAGMAALCHGEARCALVGGCDVKTHELGFIALEQQGVFRSWRQHGTGCIPGEGAAFLVLEHETPARARGARVYARLRGCALKTVAARATRSRVYADALRPLVQRESCICVSAGDGDTALADAETDALRGLECAATVVARPKAQLGNLFAAAAALQVGLGAAFLRNGSRGSSLVANCFGYGSEQAAFLLERP